jgi:acyl dehydratase
MSEIAIQKDFYYEDYELGQHVTSAARTVTETDIVSFAALTGDWNQIHVDAEAAAKGIFGQRVAHGLLGLSIASGLAIRLGFMEETVLAFRELGTWKFSLPIFIGDTIRVRAEVSQMKEMRRLGGGLVTFKVQILNQRDEVVQRGTWLVLVKGREG